MLSLTIYPKTTYISSFKETESFYYKTTLLSGNSICNDTNYISILKLNNTIELNDFNLIDASLNIHLINGCNTSLEEIRQSLVLCKIVENFNIKSVSWENHPKAIPLNLDKCDYSYNQNNNIISFNLSSIFNSYLDFPKSIYGLAIICRPTFKSKIYKFYSANSMKAPFLNINYTNCNNINSRKLEMIFKEEKFIVESLDSEFYSTPLNISNFNTGTYFIKNSGTSTIYTSLQVSPDGNNFANDVVEAYINPGESIALTLGKFLKFSRIKFINKDINPNSNLEIWFQGQTLDYYIK